MKIRPDKDVPTQPLLRIEYALTPLKLGILKKLKGNDTARSRSSWLARSQSCTTAAKARTDSGGCAIDPSRSPMECARESTTMARIERVFWRICAAK
jgi:hypothetical protein